MASDKEPRTRDPSPKRRVRKARWLVLDTRRSLWLPRLLCGTVWARARESRTLFRFFAEPSFPGMVAWAGVTRRGWQDGGQGMPHGHADSFLPVHLEVKVSSPPCAHASSPVHYWR